MATGCLSSANTPHFEGAESFTGEVYHTGEWPHDGVDFTGKTVGLIGFGHIAWKLRELLLPFGATILAHDPFAPRELADAMAIDFVPLHVVLSCGITVCLAPETLSTIGMIGEAELGLIPPDGVFVNVSRGTVVDKEALENRAARNDAWFGIDVHDPEPISVNSPLRGFRNVFLSPHIGGMTVEAQERFFSLMVNELERIVRGGEARAQLTPRVLEGRGRQQ
jgi:phosphoglycerate dehydrogenase-like enzyme